MPAALPLSSVIELCRSLRHGLGAGLPPQRLFRQQAERGPGPLRPVAAHVAAALERGKSLAASLRAWSGRLPPLLLALVEVGEETGHLPEIFGDLERHYRLQQSLRRQVRARLLGPAVQLVVAVGIITVLLFVLGALGQSRGPIPGGPVGPGAAFGFLCLVFVVAAAGAAVYLLARRLPGKGAAVQARLLRLPVLGGCLEALALQRFTTALGLTMDSGMPVERAVRLSLEATGNAAYAARADAAVAAVGAGESLTEAVAGAGGFPEAFVHTLALAEESGQVPEVMRRQAEHYREEAEVRMQRLAKVATFGVYGLYMLFMVVAIFRIAGLYLGALGR
jgi:type IV pilus assembly protein PilC